MNDRQFDRIGAACAAGLALLSIIYTVAYLGITPSDQRGTDVDDFFRSYADNPTGLRLASTCLLVAGVLAGVAVVVLGGRVVGTARRAARWATTVGVIAGFATSAHGLSDLVTVDKLSHRYATGDAATRAAVAVQHVTPSPVDPRGLATFGAAGLVALAFGLALRTNRRRLGSLGVALGIDMVVLFVATAIGLDAIVLFTGGLAAVVLGPIWWIGVSRLLWRGGPGEHVTSGAGDVLAAV